MIVLLILKKMEQITHFVKSESIYRFFLNFHYRVGLNNCAAKNSGKAVHFYALNAKIRSFLISV